MEISTWEQLCSLDVNPDQKTCPICGQGVDSEAYRASESCTCVHGEVFDLDHDVLDSEKVHSFVQFGDENAGVVWSNETK